MFGALGLSHPRDGARQPSSGRPADPEEDGQSHRHAAQLVSRRLADRALDGGFAETPYAPAQVALRATISGSAPVIKGLSYRLSVNYAFAGKNPYVVGPLQTATPAHPLAELVPVEQLRAMLGLVYDLSF